MHIYFEPFRLNAQPAATRAANLERGAWSRPACEMGSHMFSQANDSGGGSDCGSVRKIDIIHNHAPAWWGQRSTRLLSVVAAFSACWSVADIWQ